MPGIEDTYSEIFLNRIRQQLLLPGDRISKEFMNALFNTLNEMTTEIFVIFKELKNNYSAQVLKRTRALFTQVVDMFRMLEILTKWAPEIFVDKTQIHSMRLLNYVMFVLHSVFAGGIAGYVEFCCAKIMQRSETLP